jgi:hypothetical protein
MVNGFGTATLGFALGATVWAVGADSLAAATPQMPLEKMKAAFDQVQAEVKPYIQPRSDLVNRLAMMRLGGIKDVDYETLMVVSGYATSFAYHAKKFGALYQPPDPPDVTEARLTKATGFHCAWMPRVKDAGEGWEIVKKALDGGQPLQASWYDDFMILGYQDAAEPADRKLFFMGDWDEPGWRPWAKFEEWSKKFGRLARYEKAGEPEPVKDVALEMLNRTVAYAGGDGRAETPFGREVRFGLAGMEAYAADVADVAKTPDSFDAGWLGCHCINRQSQGRRCMAIYLRRVAPLFGKDAEAHLLASVGEYDAAWAAWQEFGKHLGQMDGAKETKDLKALWMVAENRKAGAAAIRKAIEREKAGVAEITRALAAMQ